MRYTKWSNKEVGKTYREYSRRYKQLRSMGLVDSRMLGPRQFEAMYAEAHRKERATLKEVKEDLLRKQSKLGEMNIKRAHTIFKQYTEKRKQSDVVTIDTLRIYKVKNAETDEYELKYENETKTLTTNFRKESRFFKGLTRHDIIAMSINSGRDRKEVLEEYGYNEED